jgi:hypothetical protein
VTATTDDDLRSTSGPTRLLATSVSEVFGPMPVGTALSVGVGAKVDGWAGAGWGLLAISFAALVPYVITWRMRYPSSGTKPSRHTRIRYLLITIGCASVGLLLVAKLGAPHYVIAMAVMIIVGLLVGTVINARWGMSNHVAASSAAVVA